MYAAVGVTLPTIVFAVVCPPISTINVGIIIGVLYSAWVASWANKYEIAAEEIERLQKLAIRYNSPIFTSQQTPNVAKGIE